MSSTSSRRWCTSPRRRRWPARPRHPAFPPTRKDGCDSDDPGHPRRCQEARDGGHPRRRERPKDVRGLCDGDECEHRGGHKVDRAKDRGEGEAGEGTGRGRGAARELSEPAPPELRLHLEEFRSTPGRSRCGDQGPEEGARDSFGREVRRLPSALSHYCGCARAA